MFNEVLNRNIPCTGEVGWPAVVPLGNVTELLLPLSEMFFTDLPMALQSYG
jgi:hypothetical protein